jgi:hypothetical protein
MIGEKKCKFNWMIWNNESDVKIELIYFLRYIYVIVNDE